MVLIATVALAILLTPTKIAGDVSEPEILNPLSSLSETPTPEEVIGAIVYISPNKEVADQILNTARCESGFNYKAIGQAGEIGILQYMPSTWKYWNEQRMKESGYVIRPLNIYSTKDQLEMLVWAWNKNYHRHWTCFSKFY